MNEPTILERGPMSYTAHPVKSFNSLETRLKKRLPDLQVVAGKPDVFSVSVRCMDRLDSIYELAIFPKGQFAVAYEDTAEPSTPFFIEKADNVDQALNGLAHCFREVEE